MTIPQRWHNQYPKDAFQLLVKSFYDGGNERHDAYTDTEYSIISTGNETIIKAELPPYFFTDKRVKKEKYEALLLVVAYKKRLVSADH